MTRVQERLDWRKREPDPRRDLEGKIESKGYLISDFGIMARLRCPVLEHDAGRVPSLPLAAIISGS
jgi:hypothetical protein